jgi:glycerophosphoryl diester phosphodiesterase
LPTVPRLALAVLATVLAAVITAPAHAATPPWMQRGVLNIAHQGGEDEFPSNTMYAFRQALAAGADVLELDVHPSVDGTLVVLHDDTVDRTTNGRGHVTDLTVVQLQRLDAAFNFVPGRDAVTGLPAPLSLARGAYGQAAASGRLRADELPDPDAAGGAARLPARAGQHRDQGA